MRAGEVGLFSLGGTSLKKEQVIYPRLAVVPMGWSHALYLCQSIHEELAGAAGLHEEDRIRDSQRVPQGRVRHTQYVDNMIVLGPDHAEVCQRYQQAVATLKEAGLQVHEEETAEGDATILGWNFSRSGQVRPTHGRAWKARLALRGLLRKGRANGRTLERLLGHLTFISLCRREALSIFAEIYVFVKANRNNRQRYHCRVECVRS